MIILEVNSMEDNQKNMPEEESSYVERPAWQVWGARIGLVLFIIILILYYGRMLRGGF